MTDNVKKFVDLQIKANNEIDTLGQTTDETFNELERIADLLTGDEVREAVDEYNRTAKQIDPLEQRQIDEYIDSQKYETI